MQPNHRYQDCSLRSAAIKALGRVGPEAVPILIELLRSSSGAPRVPGGEYGGFLGSVVNALVEIGSASVADLIETFKEPSPEMYCDLVPCVGADEIAADALVLIGRPAVPALLRALLEHENKLVRARAAEALGGIGSEDAVPALKIALEDVKPVCNSASQALYFITKETSWFYYDCRSGEAANELP